MKRRLLRATKYGATTNPSGIGSLRIYQASIDQEEDETGRSVCLVLACTPQAEEPLGSDSIVRARITWGSADGGGVAVVDCRQGARVNVEAAQTLSVDVEISGTPTLLPVGGYQMQVAVLEGPISLGRPNTFTQAPYFQGAAHPVVIQRVPAYAKTLLVLPDRPPGANVFTLRFWRSQFDFAGAIRNCGEVNGIGSSSSASSSPVPNVGTFYSLHTSGIGEVQFTPIFELQI